MKILVKKALVALMATSAVAAAAIASPAAAQVNGIATIDPAITIVRTQALQTGYQQIATQYEAQRATIDQRNQQRQNLLRPLDANGDGQLDDAELAPLQTPGNATVAQIQALDTELQQLQLPINLARIYVLQQVAEQYPVALQQVIGERSVQIILTPEALVYGPPEVDISTLVVTALNTRMPAASITPPPGWQPTEQLANLFQQVQNILMVAAAQQQQASAAAAAQAQPATSGR